MISKGLTKYLDKIFDTLEYKEDFETSRYVWTGFFLEDEEILVRESNNYTWFYNGEVLNHVKEFFSLEPSEFKENLKKYIKNKYGIKINRLI
jgi:hypothetical protein